MKIGKNGRYEVEECIGSGASGNVYRVWDRRYRRELAAKCYVNDSAANRERRILSSAKKGVTPFYYDSFKSHYGDVVIMELVEGITLASYIRKRGPAKLSKVFDWGLELADILENLHRGQERIIYRDLKPENIILGDNGHIRLVDFDTAAHVVAEGLPGGVCGTYGYAAPEQWSGRGSTVRSDIYSLGVCLYECLTGYVDTTVEDERIPKGIYEVIKTCTKILPGERYADAEKFRTAWIGAFTDLIA